MLTITQSILRSAAHTRRKVACFASSSTSTSTSSSPPRPERPIMDQTGQCNCGAVKFRVQGKILFNKLCHCRACSWAASVSPVHIIGIKTPSLEYYNATTKSYENDGKSSNVVVTQGYGKMEHGRCVDCGTQVFQRPRGRPFVAVFPPTFHIGGEDSVHQKLPEKYLPNFHANYENRAMDHHDALPKYKCFGPKDEMNNDGTLKEGCL